ncbi:Na+/H+ antiporter subunit E [Nocardioides ferulae]|uniref:Na+/H+ antiporter subunit E n=1 Tax=Nocardioides ferulae TaxID=2340821 RepID=UPI0013DE7718|nr:Na+/H+ antiporter subunit E [Nocardioides ferulae]
MTGLGGTRAVRLAVLAVAYGWRFLKANAQVAATVLTGRPRLAPVLVVVRLRCRTPAEVAAYMGLITLTPGTMAVSLTPDRTRLLVHGMHAPDVASFRADLAHLEEQLLRAMRRPGRSEAASDEQKAG